MKLRKEDITCLHTSVLAILVLEIFFKKGINSNEDAAFAHPLNSKIEFEISAIQSRPTPLRFRSQASRTRVKKLDGTF
jgi:hypothetical protein